MSLANGSPLHGLDVFVGGPIQHAIRPGGFETGVRHPIELALETLEEFGASVFSAHRTERYGVDTANFTPAQVSVRDHRWMHKCDVFVPVLPVADETLLRTDGTHIELGWASALGRPIVLITRLPFADSASHLLKGLDHVGSVRALDIDEFLHDPEILVEEVRATSLSRIFQHEKLDRLIS